MDSAGKAVYYAAAAVWPDAGLTLTASGPQATKRTQMIACLEGLFTGPSASDLVATITVGLSVTVTESAADRPAVHGKQPGPARGLQVLQGPA